MAILLGPAVNIKRSPLCGRNFEYFSEDPYLAGEMAASYISGVQSKHVGTSIKHFAVNNQERRRMTVSAVTDERTLREIYFPAFEAAVKQAQPWTVMCSYNRINGVYSSENEWLLDQVLRRDWGFQGFVMTDWGAANDRVEGIKAGLELEMPSSGGVNSARIRKGVQEGRISEETLDRAVERILEIVFHYAENRDETAVFDRAADHEKAHQAALETMVLLKNEGALPLRKDQKIAFIGEFAELRAIRAAAARTSMPTMWTVPWRRCRAKRTLSMPKASTQREISLMKRCCARRLPPQRRLRWR